MYRRGAGRIPFHVSGVGFEPTLPPYLAGLEGFEPSLTVLETVVLRITLKTQIFWLTGSDSNRHLTD